MPPAAIVAGGALAGAIPGIIAGATGAGKSTFKPRGFQESGAYDKNRFEYGGRPGVAEEAAGRFGGTERGYGEKAHEMYGQANQSYGQANQAGGLGLQARGQQGDAANLMIDRARGRNLVTTGVANRARTDLGSRMQSNIASARGPAALANAQSDAAAAQAQGLGNIASNEMTSSMAEQAGAEQAAFGAASGMRQGDAQAQGLSIQQGGQQGNEGLGFGQLGATYGNMEQDVRRATTNANVSQQGIMAQSEAQRQGIDAGVQGNNAQQDMKYIEMVAGGVQGGAQMGMNAPGPGGAPKPKADGGPVQAREKLLVGERGREALVTPRGAQMIGVHGPEIIVPKEDGFVVPNHDLGIDFEAPSRERGLGEGYNFGAAMSRINDDLPDPNERKLRDPTSFKRDTSGDQRKIAAKYKAAEAERLMREADELMAGMDASLASGASVHVPDTRTPMPERNMNAGPYRDPDGIQIDDEDWTLRDDDTAEARLPGGGDLRIARREDGGELKAGQPAVVGEAGKEAFLPRAGRAVESATYALAPGAGGVVEMARSAGRDFLNRSRAARPAPAAPPPPPPTESPDPGLAMPAGQRAQVQQLLDQAALHDDLGKKASEGVYAQAAQGLLSPIHMLATVPDAARALAEYKKRGQLEKQAGIQAGKIAAVPTRPLDEMPATARTLEIQTPTGTVTRPPAVRVSDMTPEQIRAKLAQLEAAAKGGSGGR